MNPHSPVARDTLACVVSVTPRPDPEGNEDACEAACSRRTGLRAVVVADGLGSYSQARRAARLATAAAAAWLRDEREEFGRSALARLFAHAHEHLRATAREDGGGAAPPPQTYGTTLLVGVDAGEELVAGYAGNGAIWHIRGNFGHFPANILPWNAVNLLNPHTLLRNGREVLYNLLDAADEDPPAPTIVSVRKDPRFGDILLLCSDGVFSADQVTQGTDDGGRLWTAAEPAMLACYQALRELFAEWDGASELPLHDALHTWLHDLRARGLLEDDATVGVLVTADALRYVRRARGTPDATETSSGAAKPAADADATTPRARGTEEERGASMDPTHDGQAGEEAECRASPASAA